MKRIVIYIAIVLAMLSCKAQYIEQSTINGEFYKLFKDKYFPYAYSLQLNGDSTFKLKVRVEKCQGKWELKNGLILLNCNEEPYVSRIASGYMFKREHKIEVLSKNRLKFDDVILRRKK